MQERLPLEQVAHPLRYFAETWGFATLGPILYINAALQQLE
jgi:hypothetical protein